MEIELNNDELSLLDNNSSHKLKKSHSLLEYIINHRQDILEKVELERQNRNSRPTNPISNNEIRELKKKLAYIHTIGWLIVFVLYGFLGGIFINAISGVPLINYDMIFNVMISPIIYYHSPRNILCNISIGDFFKYYSPFFVLGLGFRFLDVLPGFNDFTLDPNNIHTPTQIGLVFCISLLLCILSGYFIILSSEPTLHFILLLLEITMVLSTSYFFIQNKGRIHIHHYFIGLIIMMVSKNYHSKIVIISHSIAYAVYIEGISKWGIDPLYWIELR
jgi:hypothetical protein